MRRTTASLRHVSKRVQCVALATLALVACNRAPEHPRPNVVIYVIDTLRRDHLGAYGSALVDSPNIDRIAAEGLTFDRAYAPASWTRSSMATLLSGVPPTHHRTEDRDSVLPEAILTLGEALRAAGYATAFVTANPNAGKVFGFDQGFDELAELYAQQPGGIIDPYGAMARSDTVTDRAIEWIDRTQSPFLLVVLAIDPHAPHNPPEDLIEAELRKTPIESADDERQKFVATSRVHYRAEIAFNDISFGRLVDHLIQRGLLDDTVLVLTADHGEEFWEHGKYQHGQSLYDEVLRIPMIVRYPRSERARAGVRSDTPARLSDVMPTVLDLAGVAIPGSVRGRSLVDPEAPPPPAIFSRLALDGHDLVSIRDHPWKLIRDERTGQIQLFNLVDDPDERSSLDDPVQQRRLEALLEMQLDDQIEFESGTARESELPEDVRESLRALGYLE